MHHSVRSVCSNYLISLHATESFPITHGVQVIAVPIRQASSWLQGIDELAAEASAVEGAPLATVATNRTDLAAHMALRIGAVKYDSLRARLEATRF